MRTPASDDRPLRSTDDPLLVLEHRRQGGEHAWLRCQSVADRAEVIRAMAVHRPPPIPELLATGGYGTAGGELRAHEEVGIAATLDRALEACVCLERQAKLAWLRRQERR